MAYIRDRLFTTPEFFYPALLGEAGFGGYHSSAQREFPLEIVSSTRLEIMSEVAVGRFLITRDPRKSPEL